MTFWEHAWQAKWGILIVAGFLALVTVAVVRGWPKPSTADCEANGGRLVIPRLDERQADPNRYKTSPGFICKYDQKAE